MGSPGLRAGLSLRRREGRMAATASSVRERGHGVDDSVPDGPMPSAGPRLGFLRLTSLKSQVFL